MILDYKYYLPRYTPASLLRHGWNYSTKYSNQQDIFYTQRFPVYKYRNIPEVICELILNFNTKEVNIQVTTLSGDPYAAFYNREYSTPNLVVDQVEDEIKKNMKRLGVKKKK